MSQEQQNERSDSTRGAGDPSGLAAGRTAVGNPGMADPVTRHAQMTDGPCDEWRFLTCGIDTLDLGLHVTWDPSYWVGFIRTLKERKEEARELNGVMFNGWKCGPVLVRPHGKGHNYAFHLQWPDLHLFLAAREKPDDHWPNVYASPTAKTLWITGVNGVHERIVNLIEELNGHIDQIKVSRVDLAADFIVPNGLALEFIRAHRVGRGRKTFHVMQEDRLQTFYVGEKKSPIQARIYDKAAEIRARGEKAWMVGIWNVEACRDIWRFEFQLRRAYLKEYGINSIDDLKKVIDDDGNENGKAGGLWSHLTENYFSLRLPDNVHTARRTVHPLWKRVQECANLFGPSLTLNRDVPAMTLAEVDWYISHIGGCMLGYAVRNGKRERPTVLRMLLADLEEYWQEKACWEEEFDKKAILRGDEPGEDCNVPF